MKTLTLLLVLIFTHAIPAQGGGKGNRLTTRIAQALGFKTGHSLSLPKQLFLTSALACTMLACGSIKPALYDIGLLNPNSAMRAETISTSLHAAQRDFDSDGTGTTIIPQHVYVHRNTGMGYEGVLAEVIETEEDNLTIQIYDNKYELTIAPEDVKAYLIDDHPSVGRKVKLPTHAVGFSHFNGTVIAVYNNDMLVIKVTSKTDLDGKDEKLHKKDDAPHIRFAYEYKPR